MAFYVFVGVGNCVPGQIYKISHQIHNSVYILFRTVILRVFREIFTTTFTDSSYVFEHGSFRTIKRIGNGRLSPWKFSPRRVIVRNGLYMKSRRFQNT
jgi:hypothetical protein